MSHSEKVNMALHFTCKRARQFVVWRGAQRSLVLQRANNRSFCTCIIVEPSVACHALRALSVPPSRCCDACAMWYVVCARCWAPASSALLSNSYFVSSQLRTTVQRWYLSTHLRHTTVPRVQWLLDAAALCTVPAPAPGTEH